MTYDPMNAPSGSSGPAGASGAAGTSANDSANQSVGQLLSEISADMSTLMRQELELAKAELKQEGVKASETLKEEGAKAGKAAGVFGAAGYVGHLAVLFLSLALWYLIASIIDSPGWAFLIVGVLYAIVAGVLASMGKKKMKDVDLSRLKQVNPTPEQTVETLQEVPGALKPSN